MTYSTPALFSFFKSSNISRVEPIFHCPQLTLQAGKFHKRGVPPEALPWRHVPQRIDQANIDFAALIGRRERRYVLWPEIKLVISRLAHQRDHTNLLPPLQID